MSFWSRIGTWIGRSSRTTRSARRAARGRRPRLEGLEERLAPAIVRGDDRQRITPTTGFPYSAIVQGYSEWSDGSSTYFSGAMISPYHVLTAAQSIRKTGPAGAWATNVRVAPGSDGTHWGAISSATALQSTNRPYGEANVIAQRAFSWTPDDHSYDLALVTLDRKIGNLTGWFDLGADDAGFGVRLAKGANMAGYPMNPGAPDHRLFWGKEAAVGVAVDRYSAIYLDVTYGQWGGPLWQDEPVPGGSVSRIYGVATEETTNVNRFTKITSGKLQTLANWMAEDNANGPPVDRPDLADFDDWYGTSSASISSSVLDVGQLFSLTAWVRNNGTAAAGSFDVRFYASADASIGYDDYYLGSTSVGSLDRLAYTSASLSNVALPAMPAGNYYVGWIIDSGNSQSEYREDNNAATLHSTLLTVLPVPYDTFANPSYQLGSLASGTVTGRNDNATRETNEPNHASGGGNKSVWYTWTAPGDGPVTIWTEGSSFDTLLGVYTGNSVDALTTIASNDDAGGGARWSLVSFTASAGTIYRIAVDGYAGAGGPFTLNLAWSLVNDQFATRAILGGSRVNVSASSAAATKEPGEPNHAGGSGGKSLWYEWTPVVSGTVTIDTAGSDFDTLLGVYTGTAVNALTTISYDDDVSSFDRTSVVTFTAVAGTSYKIAVDGYDGGGGNVKLNIRLVPGNDLFANRIRLAEPTLKITGNNQNSGEEVGEPRHTSGPVTGHRSVWYEWTAPFSGPVTIDMAGSSMYSAVGLYTGTAVDALTRIDLGGYSLPIHFTATAGTAYQIAVDGVPDFLTRNPDDTSQGTFSLNITSAPRIERINSAAANGTYGANRAIPVTVTFTSPVQLSNAGMVVTLSTGATITIAPFAGLALTATGVYTVATGHNSLDLNVMEVTLAAGATLRGAAGNDAVLTLPTTTNLADLNNLEINTTPATVERISSTASNGAYRAGQAIPISITFSKPVLLSGGHLVVKLDTGGTITLVPNTNARATWTGTYTVAAGENSADLNVTALTLAPDTTLRDAAGNDTTLSLPATTNLANLNDLVIDTTPATITRISSTAVNGAYGTGRAIPITLTFSEPVLLRGGNLIVHLNTGGTMTLAPGTTASATWTGIYVVAAGQLSADLNVTAITPALGAVLRDVAGNDTTLSLSATTNLATLSNLVIDAVITTPRLIRPTIGVVLPATSRWYTITGVVEAGNLVRIYRDTNGDGRVSPGDAIVSAVRLRAGVASFALSVPLTPYTLNRFLVVAIDTLGNISTAKVVPTIKAGPTRLVTVTFRNNVSTVTVSHPVTKRALFTKRFTGRISWGFTDANRDPIEDIVVVSLITKRRYVYNGVNGLLLS